MAPHRSVASPPHRPSLRGQLLSVKAIIYLVFTLIFILLAVTLLVKVYNVFLGGSPAKQDAALMAQVINDALATNDQYSQTPFILRLNPQDTIVGFGPGEQTVTFKTQHVCPVKECTAEFDEHTYNRGSDCGADACVCDADSGSSKVIKCFSIHSSKYSGVLLASNYFTQLTVGSNYNAASGALTPDLALDADTSGVANRVVSPPTTPATPPMPADYAGTYNKLLIDLNLVSPLKVFGIAIAQSDSGKTPLSTVPLILEKNVYPVIAQPGTKQEAIVVVELDTQQARARDYYLYVCPMSTQTGSDGKPLPDVCKGQTGASSTTPVTSKSLADSGFEYCAVNPLDGTCLHEAVPKCAPNELIAVPCVCPSKPDTVSLDGFCSSAGVTPLNCNGVTNCDGYCTEDGYPGCTSIEQNVYCPSDPCHVAEVGNRCAPPTDPSKNGCTQVASTAAP